jgi:hypothetical protein
MVLEVLKQYGIFPKMMAKGKIKVGERDCGPNAWK